METAVDGMGPPERAPEDPTPQDKIPCQGRFLRRVVACMHNCPIGEDYCTVFWRFFSDQGRA